MSGKQAGVGSDATAVTSPDAMAVFRSRWLEARLSRWNRSDGIPNGSNNYDNSDDDNSTRSYDYNHHQDDNAHFWRCWGHQDCRSCLRQPACSWCPFSSACVPNDCPLPALAPAFDELVCPHWAERWELRTRPLGCQVSTITTLTALVAGSGTLAVALLVYALIRGGRWLRQRQGQRLRRIGSQQQGRFVRWLRPQNASPEILTNETSPLLS